MTLVEFGPPGGPESGHCGRGDGFGEGCGDPVRGGTILFYTSIYSGQNNNPALTECFSLYCLVRVKM